MKTKLTFSIIVFLLINLVIQKQTKAQEFKTNKITDRVFALTNLKGGEDQLFISSDKGLVAINSSWSNITAEKFKKEIVNVLKRDDFIYTINMVDRLDMFGGNNTYKETVIIGHQEFLSKYKGKETKVAAEIKQLVDMWRWKEGVSLKRLKNHKPDSKDYKNEQKWANTCKQRADELEKGFSLILPSITYKDRMTLDLGNLTLNLIYFGKAGYDGMSVIIILEEKLAIIPGFILHSQHLAPSPYNRYAELDVERWICVLEEILEGKNAVDKVACDIISIWTRERALTHLKYIRKLWNSVKKAEANGKELKEIQMELSLENEFKFVKQMQVYQDHGDDWVRPQHKAHVRLFYLQHKNLASEFIKEEMQKSSLQNALIKVKKLQDNRGDIYFDESSLNSLGYNFINSGKIQEAIEIFKLNVKMFPKSSNVYDSLGEAYMKNKKNTLAIKNYKMALKLNPDNENAKKMLQKLNN